MNRDESHRGDLPPSPSDVPAGNDAVPPPADLLGHLALALSRHVRELRRQSVPVPPEIEELAGFLFRLVRSRPELRSLGRDVDVAPRACGTDRLLLTKREAAERLGVSERTIDRLVASGRLPLVHVERAARLRVSDLEAYVSDLAVRPAPHPTSE